MRIIIASAFLFYAFLLILAGQCAQAWVEKHLGLGQRKPLDLGLAKSSPQNKFRALLLASIDYGRSKE